MSVSMALHIELLKKKTLDSINGQTGLRYEADDLDEDFLQAGLCILETCLWPEFAKGMEREILKGRAIWNDSLHRYISRMLMDIFLLNKWTLDHLDTV